MFSDKIRCDQTKKISMASNTELWIETPAVLRIKHPATYAQMQYVVAKRWRMQYVMTQGSLWLMLHLVHMIRRAIRREMKTVSRISPNIATVALKLLNLIPVSEISNCETA